MHVLDIVLWIVVAIVVIFIGHFLYLVAHSGLSAAVTWVKAWWGKSKTALAALEADVAALKSRVTKLETNPAPQPAPTPQPAPAPAPAAPATPAS